MAEEQQGPPAPTYPNGVVVNYGALVDYEPRISDPTGKGGKEAWGRGVPRFLVAYCMAAFVPLLILSFLGPLQTLFGLFGTPMHLLAVGSLAVLVGGWAWAMPPGGVRAHHAIPAIVRGLGTPRLLLGWRPVGHVPTGWAPAELLIEPDFAGTWPRTQVVGPAKLVRSQAAVRQVALGARAGEVGQVLIESIGPRREGPVLMEVPAGHVVELRPVGAKEGA